MDHTPLRSGLIYLATPYTKYPAGIHQAFHDAVELAARLIRLGICVYSPIAYGHPISMVGDIDPLDQKFWLSFDESMMQASCALVVAHMEGWEESQGIAHEIKFFESQHKPIFDLDPKYLLMVRRRELKPVRDRIDGELFDEVERARKEWLGVQT